MKRLDKITKMIVMASLEKAFELNVGRSMTEEEKEKVDSTYPLDAGIVVRIELLNEKRIALIHEMEAIEEKLAKMSEEAYDIAAEQFPDIYDWNTTIDMENNVLHYAFPHFDKMAGGDKKTSSVSDSEVKDMFSKLGIDLGEDESKDGEESQHE